MFCVLKVKIISNNFLFETCFLTQTFCFVSHSPAGVRPSAYRSCELAPNCSKTLAASRARFAAAMCRGEPCSNSVHLLSTSERPTPQVVNQIPRFKHVTSYPKHSNVREVFGRPAQRRRRRRSAAESCWSSDNARRRLRRAAATASPFDTPPPRHRCRAHLLLRCSAAASCRSVRRGH